MIQGIYPEPFFAHPSRMKFIQRLSLIRNVIQENIQEHSLQAAMIAYSLINLLSFPVS